MRTNDAETAHPSIAARMPAVTSPSGVPAGRVAEAVVAQVDCDMLCSQCGCNLIDTPVTIDADTRLAVCRCVDCGARTSFNHANGVHPTIARLVNLPVWVYASTVLLSLFTAAIVLMETLSRSRSIWPVNIIQTIEPFSWHGLLHYATVDVLLGYVLLIGILLANVFWFHTSWRRFCWLLPAAAWLLVVVYGSSVESYYPSFSAIEVERWWNRLFARLFTAGVLLATIALGLWLGRPIGRAVLRVVMPPGLLQYLGFLWWTDGLRPPIDPKARW